MELIIQLIAGAVGGTAAGAALKNLSLGPALNAIVGLVGGAGGAQLLAMLGLGAAGAPADAAAAGGMDMAAIVQNVLGGGVGGGVLVAIVGVLKKALVKA